MAWRSPPCATSNSTTAAAAILPFSLKHSPPPLLTRLPCPLHAGRAIMNNSRRKTTLSTINGGRYWPLMAPRRRGAFAHCKARKGGEVSDEGGDLRRALQTALWGAEAVYVLWLFLLPYAPGDPVWAINSGTINDLVGLSINFFLIDPLLNSVGIHLIEAPVLHPIAEGLFNLVIGWTFLFAPLLFTDCRRDRYEGSLDLLWGFQMFLTNTLLIPYMAIRLNDTDGKKSPPKLSQLASVMTNGAPIVGLIGGFICLLSVWWAFFGRFDGGFGGFADRWEFLQQYIASERFAYAFIWDIGLYAIFQPWLIGDNVQNVRENSQTLVGAVRFIPIVGLIAYLLCLDGDKDSC